MSEMGLFAKIVNGLNLVTFFAKIPILDVSQGSEYVSGLVTKV